MARAALPCMSHNLSWRVSGIIFALKALYSVRTNPEQVVVAKSEKSPLALAWLPTTVLRTLQPHPGFPVPVFPGPAASVHLTPLLSSPPVVTASEGHQSLLAHAAATLPLLKAINSFLLPITTKHHQPPWAPDLSLLPVPHPWRLVSPSQDSQRPAGLSQKPFPSPPREQVAGLPGCRLQDP